MMNKPWLLLIGALLLIIVGGVTQIDAEVNVEINLPVIRFAAPPDVVVIPGTYVYMVPDLDADILFYQGYWWRPYEGRWYRSRDYRGPWRFMDPRRIPDGLRALPHDYHHHLSHEYGRIHYGDVQRNWKKWETERHWDRRGEQGRVEHDEHDREGRGEHEHEGRGEYDGRGHDEHERR